MIINLKSGAIRTWSVVWILLAVAALAAKALPAAGGVVEKTLAEQEQAIQDRLRILYATRQLLAKIPTPQPVSTAMADYAPMLDWGRESFRVEE